MSLTFPFRDNRPRLQECPVASKQELEESQGEGTLSSLPSPLLFTLSPFTKSELPPRPWGSRPGGSSGQRAIYCQVQTALLAQLWAMVSYLQTESVCVYGLDLQLNDY